jgi:hypothetical protein
MPGDRERLAHRLEAVRPAAVGVPDRAILIVPRLVARRALPRYGDAGLFTGEVVEGLRAALRRARRPGEACSSGDSLLFIDELDAQASLIGQWLAGVPPAEREWWHHLTAGAAPPVWWRRSILPDGRRLPSLIVRLADRGLAERWIERLEAADVRTGLAAIAEAHGVRLPPACPVRVPPRRPRRPRLDALRLAPAVGLVEAVAPEALRADLAPMARLLLLLGLVAGRRPAMLSVRSAATAFAAAASACLVRPESKPAPGRRRSQGTKASPAARPIVRDRPDEPGPGPLRAGPTTALPTSAGKIAERCVPARSPPRRSTAPAPADPPPPVERRLPVEAAAASLKIETEFGGLLFVLNALLALGLYGDFSQPARSIPGLSPYGLLRLLGRSWFGAAFVADPLHALLVRFAGGRRADAPGDFEAPPWSVPAAWLSPWPKAETALVGGHRLRPMLWHPAGFPLAELDSMDPGAAARVARRLGLRRTTRAARLPALPAAPRARWVACLRLYLEARTARALSCADGSEAVAMLCRRPARIVAEGERLDARFALDRHPLAIRLAGLDRDPGWIPAARRDFRYAFE